MDYIIAIRFALRSTQWIVIDKERWMPNLGSCISFTVVHRIYPVMWEMASSRFYVNADWRNCQPGPLA